MDPTDSEHDASDAPSQLTVTFDDVQGPYRRRLLLSAAAVALTLVVCGAAWRLSTLPGSPSTRQAHRSAGHGRRHARRARRVAPARRASAPPAARPRRLTQARSPNRRRAVSTSAIPPNPGPSRLKINSSVGPARPLSRPAVGQGPRQGTVRLSRQVSQRPTNRANGTRGSSYDGVGSTKTPIVGGARRCAHGT